MTATLEDQVQEAEGRWLEHWRDGPRRTRWTALPLQAGDPAPSFRLPDQAGLPFELKNLWHGRAALVLFWRHFGCSCGVDRARRLIEEYPKIVEMGADVAIIAQGEPERAAAYIEKYALPPVRLLSDPAGSVYEAYGLLEGKPSQVVYDAPETFLDRDYETGVRFCRQRREDGRPPVDNPWLLPGEFVVRDGGEVVLAYRYNFCEDYPDARVLYAAVREATRAVEP
jgi:peroxiredoxin